MHYVSLSLSGVCIDHNCHQGLPHGPDSLNAALTLRGMQTLYLLRPLLHGQAYDFQWVFIIGGCVV